MCCPQCAVVELGIYLDEDEECTITFCGVGLWAGLTGYCQKHVAALVHWRCLEINDSSVESHGEDAFYGTEHEGKSVCVCLALCVCVIVCTVSVVTCVLSPREPHLFPSYCALKTSTCAARPDSCHFEQTRAAQWRPDENDMNEMKHQVQWAAWQITTDWTQHSTQR